MKETVRKTYKEKLRPTPKQERKLEQVLWRCRDPYNAALEQRITAWQRRLVSVSRYNQEGALAPVECQSIGPRLPTILRPRQNEREGGISSLSRRCSLQ